MRGLRRYALGMMVAATLAAVAPASAETQTETIVAEQRTSLSLRITPEAARSLLPEGWESSAGPTAPNLSLIFMDRALGLGPDGQKLGTGVNRLLVMAMGAKNTQTGETRTLIVGGYSADPVGSPGAYNVYGKGSMEMARTERIDSAAVETVQERWTVKTSDGGVLNVDLTFKRGVPTLNPFELKIYSAVQPDFYRIYRGRQTTDVIRNASSGVDRVQAVAVEASGGRLGEILKDAGPALAVSNSPFYSRETFLP